jgi:2-C-methyl-D-erythritol 4-phosphate cytidylyltransferase
MIFTVDSTQKVVVAAVVVAAGSGKRMSRSLPKQFIEISGKPILQHTLERLQSSQFIDHIVAVIPSDYLDSYGVKMLQDWKMPKLKMVVPGGESRHDSVWHGLEALDEKVDLVMIHDGVRPFLTDRMIRESMQSAQQQGAAIVGLIPRDTIKVIADHFVKKTLNREQLLIVQTPQTFKKEVIVKAYEQAYQTQSFSTDDSALVEQIGCKVAVVEGDWCNIKITSPEDLIVAKAYLESTGENRSRI